VRRRRPAARAAAAAVALALAAGADAHVVYERTSLREWVTRSELVVLAAFESDAQTWTAPGDADRQEFFRVRAVETLRGVAPGGPFDFFPHAEGFPGFRAGQRALLFLERTAGRPEFAGLAERFPWFSVQGAGQEWIVEGDAGARTLAAARRWQSLRDDAGTDLAAVRAALVDQLGSGVPRLRADAVAEAMRMHPLPGFLDADGVAALAPFAADPALSLTQRLALLQLLDGAPGFDAAPLRRAIAREAQAGSGAELAQMVRVAGASDDPALHAWLASLADDPRPWLRRAVEEARAAAALRATGAAPAPGPGAGAPRSAP
jgi:hypothetical protein